MGTFYDEEDSQQRALDQTDPAIDVNRQAAETAKPEPPSSRDAVPTSALAATAFDDAIGVTLPAAAIEDRAAPRAISSDRIVERRLDASAGGLVGNRFGDFEVLEQLGQGGMGVVFAARDPALGRKVAIKVLRDTGPSTLARQRLMREAQAMAQLAHPNVITVHQVGIREGQVFVVMEYVEGGTLKTWMEAPHDYAEVLALFSMAGRGLSAAHKAGLIHRDFKPDNVLLFADGRAGVTDFGLVGVDNDEQDKRAKLLEASGPSSELSLSLTKTGDVMGTPYYMAPEQFLGRKNDARTDQFAFCVALYEALYDRRPFPGRTYKQLAANVLAGTPLPPPVEKNVPRWLFRVIERGLAADPGDRFANMDELLAALARDPRRARRIWLGVATSALLLIGLGFGAAYLARDNAYRCKRAGHEIDAIWTPQKKKALAAAFAGAAQAGERITALFDAYQKRWKAERRSSCQATFVDRTQSAALFERRGLCLDQYLYRFDELIAQVQALGERSAETALPAAIRLPDFAECRDREHLMNLPPVPAGKFAAYKTTLKKIVRGRTKRVLDKIDEARVLIDEGLEEAKQIAYLPLVAYALLESGHLDVARSKHAAAETRFRAAIKAAAAGKATHIEARAWLSLIFTLGHRQARTEAALALRPAAEAAVARAGDRPDLLARLAGNIGLILVSKGDQLAAKKELERSLTLYETVVGKNHLDTATARNNYGMLLNKLGQHKKAYRQLELVLALRERVLGNDHPDVATTLNDMGNAAHSMGKLALAKRHFERALALQQKRLGPQNPRTGNTTNNLAIVLGDMGQHRAALELARRALAIAEAHYGKNHPELAGALNTLGNQLRELGQQKAAWEAYARGLALIEWAWGKEHVAAAPFRENLARILAKMKLHDRALSFVDHAIRLRERWQGKRHPLVIDAVALRGALNLRANRPQQAMMDFERQLALAKAAFGERGAGYGQALFNLAIGCERQKLHERALSYYRQAARVFAQNDSQGPLHVSALRGVGDVSYKKGDYGSAQTAYEAAVRLAAVHNVGSLGTILHLLGRSLAKQRRYSDARRAYERALPLRKTGDPAQLALTELRLAEVLWDGKLDHARAKKLARSARLRFKGAGKRAEDNVKEANAWLEAHR